MAAASGPTEMRGGGGVAGTAVPPHNFANKRTEADYITISTYPLPRIYLDFPPALRPPTRVL